MKKDHPTCAQNYNLLANKENSYIYITKIGQNKFELLREEVGPRNEAAAGTEEGMDNIVSSADHEGPGGKEV